MFSPVKIHSDRVPVRVLIVYASMESAPCMACEILLYSLCSVNVCVKRYALCFHVFYEQNVICRACLCDFYTCSKFQFYFDSLGYWIFERVFSEFFWFECTATWPTICLSFEYFGEAFQHAKESRQNTRIISSMSMPMAMSTCPCGVCLCSLMCLVTW